MIADRCEINRQIRADNKMLRELKAKVAKLVEAVEKSIPIIAETLEAIRNHMIFTQYHLLHNEMQKEVIHDWMQHFRPILNQYDTIKKKLKAKVAEKKELNVQKNKTSILNPFQHIKVKRIFAIRYATCRITRNPPASGPLLMICHNRIAASQLIRSGLYHS